MKNEYYLKLQKELENYPYKSDYVHKVGGINIPIPMIYGDATSVMHFFIVETKMVKQFIKDKRVKPISIFLNKTVLAINIFEYRKSAVGHFNEFTFSIPIMLDAKINLPIFPLIFDQRFDKLGFYVLQLGASNDIAREHIEKIWGYPTYKNNLDVSLSTENGYINSIIQEKGNNILTISERSPKKQNFKLQRKKFNSYFLYDNELRQVELNTLLFSKMWLGRRDFKIEIGDHQISEILRKLNIKTKIATVFYPYAIEIASRPKII
jgi:hypothetical protein